MRPRSIREYNIRFAPLAPWNDFGSDSPRFKRWEKTTVNRLLRRKERQRRGQENFNPPRNT